MKLTIYLLISLLLASLTYAIPVPHGISGTVYDLDANTQVMSGIDFKITNLNNQFTLSGRTGRGSNTGAFSATVAGNDGDVINIKTWNIEHSSQVNVTLSGYTSGISLLLNMTLSPYPPNITSSPILNATEGLLYKYDVEAFDYNYNDIINYSIVLGPNNMLINNLTGRITWIPNQNHTGNNLIKIGVSDKNFTTIQTFNVYVENVNDLPIFLSSPKLNILSNDVWEYFYQIYDLDNDSIELKMINFPDGMSHDPIQKVIRWRPKPKDVGLHHVLLRANDSSTTVDQLFVLEVIKHNSQNPGQSGSGGGGGAGFGLGESQGQNQIIQESDIFRELFVTFTQPQIDPNIEIVELDQKPVELEGITKRVYRYIEVNKLNFEDSDILEAIVEFEVDSSWLEEHSVEPSNIILNRYTDSWEELDTQLVNVNSNRVLYRAKVPGFSYFAISVKDEVSLAEINLNQNLDIKKLEESYAISGFFMKNKNKQEKTEYTFSNINSNFTVNGQSGIDGQSGAFLVIVPAKIGDQIKIEAMDAQIILNMTGDFDGLLLIKEDDQLVALQTNPSNQITGLTIAPMQTPYVVSYFAVMVMLVIIIIFSYRRIRRG